MSEPITVIDYGVGNVASIANMLKKVGVRTQVTSDPASLSAARKLVLPGVGAFDRAAVRLRETGLRELLIDRARAGIPILGVCLGMQLLLDGSDEGAEPGLGLIPGRVRRFPQTLAAAGLRVPHMGWNSIHRVHHDDALPSVEEGDRFYFVHSYFAEPDEAGDVLATTTHGVTFASALCRGTVTGVQFHPEKSHRTGLRLLSDFARG
jgi:glutamine amidotransferase